MDTPELPRLEGFNASLRIAFENWYSKSVYKYIKDDTIIGRGIFHKVLGKEIREAMYTAWQAGYEQGHARGCMDTMNELHRND